MFNVVAFPKDLDDSWGAPEVNVAIVFREPEAMSKSVGRR